MSAPMSSPPHRPITPLRSTSRTSFRASHTPSHTPSSMHPGYNTNNPNSTHPSLISPLTALEPAFAELSDSLADLESNMALLSLQHESVARFTENFAAFLYGVDMNAYCVDWVEAPGKESWERVKRRREQQQPVKSGGVPQQDGDARGGVAGTTPRKWGAGADASVLSTASTRTAGSSSNSRLRTPARRSGIARGAITGGRGSGRPGSVQGSSVGTRGASNARGRAASSAGLANTRAGRTGVRGGRTHTGVRGSIAGRGARAD